MRLMFALLALSTCGPSFQVYQTDNPECVVGEVTNKFARRERVEETESQETTSNYGIERPNPPEFQYHTLNHVDVNGERYILHNFSLPVDSVVEICAYAPKGWLLDQKNLWPTNTTDNVIYRVEAKVLEKNEEEFAKYKCRPFQ